MADPERLLDGGTEFERSLLRGGLSERPSRDLSRRMAVGIGVSGALSYTSTAKAFVQSWWGKATVALVVGAGVAGVVAVTTRAPAPESPLGPSAPAKVVAPAEPAELETTDLESLALELDPDDPSEAADEGSGNSRASRPGARASKNAAQTSLAQEIKLLDQARALVKQGDRAGAARVLKAYQQRYPHGVLQREARVLSARARAD